MYLSKKFSSISPSATLAIDSKFKAMKAEGMDVVGFGAGEPDFPTPRHIKDAAIYAIEKYKENFIPNGFHCGAKEDYLYKLANIIE